MQPLPVLAASVIEQAPESACGPVDTATAVCRAVYGVTGNDLVAKASDALVVRPAKVVFVLLGALNVTGLARRALTRFVAGLSGARVQRGLLSLRERAPGAVGPEAGVQTARAAQRAKTIGALLRSVITAGVWSIAILMVMSEMGLNLGPLIAGAGIIGIALGFGAQNMVRDFLSGIFMLIEDQYGVGDVIDAGPATGVVEGISLRTTRLRDVEGTVWHIPNGAIPHVGNKSQQWSRALLDIEVSYATDTGQAEAVIQEVADQMSHDPEWSSEILGRPEVWGVESLGADGVTIRLVVRTRPLSQWNVARQLRSRIKAAFAEAGIEIPFPQRVVWHRTEDANGDQPRVPSPPGRRH